MGTIAHERVSGQATLGEIALALHERGEKVALRQLRDLAIGDEQTDEQTAGARPGSARDVDAARSISYRRLGELAVSIAKGLMTLGVQRGESVAILSSTRAEWTVFELGALCAGAVVVPIYHTNSPEECAYVLRHSESTVVLCEDEGQRAKVEAVRESCPHLRQIVVLSPAPGASAAPQATQAPQTDASHPDASHPISLSRLMQLGQGLSQEDVAGRVSEVGPEDVATIVYTSGTTGPPKGCVITHRSIVETVRMYRERLRLTDDGVIYMFLPLAHVLARVAQLVVIDVGGTLVYWSGDASKIVQEAGEAEPTHFVAVPRVYEKIHNAVVSNVEGKGPVAKMLFAWAIEVGRRARPRRRAKRPVRWLFHARLALAERIGLAAVRELFGRRLRVALVGAAPVDARLLQFFDACGVLVLEGYGMTESCAAATLNPPDAPRFGTVGTALPGTEIAIAADGEVLISGPHVFARYHRNEAASKETFQDRWLKSGDLGSLSPDGYLTVTGRKKDLIVTSSGKNIGPVEIENGLRETRWISEAVVYGDRRPYLVAMLTLDHDEIGALGRRVGIERASMEALANDERVRKLLWEDVAENNARFARIEQIKRFGILPHELSQEAGELTPTLKVKRSFVYEKYSPFFDRLYEESR